jgi:UDP-N-acetylglucosamine 3-dehydrogenase
LSSINCTKNTIGVLIIGYGTMGKKHFISYQKIKQVKIVGVVDHISPIFTNLEQKVPHFKTIQEAFAQLKQVDVIDICLPTYLHTEYVKIAAQHGKAIICEKPIARTMEEAEEIIQVCKTNNVHLYIGHVVRFFPEYKAAKKMILEERIGDTVHIYMFRNSPYPKSWNSWYKDDKKSGGLILDLLIHDIDFLQWVYGSIVHVTARSETVRESRKSLDKVDITLNFVQGLTAKVEGSWSHRPFSTNFTITGTKGKIIADSSLLKHIVTDEQCSRILMIEKTVGSDPYTEELRHFIDAIRENRASSIITPRQAYDAVRICLAAKESVETGKTIHLDSVKESSD